MALKHDIVLDDEAFSTASFEMALLKTRTTNLRTKLQEMYKSLHSAMDTPAGAAVETATEKVLIKPIDDMLLVIDHISTTLTEVMKTGRYKDVFIKFEELNNSIK